MCGCLGVFWDSVGCVLEVSWECVGVFWCVLGCFGCVRGVFWGFWIVFGVCFGCVRDVFGVFWMCSGRFWTCSGRVGVFPLLLGYLWAFSFFPRTLPAFFVYFWFPPLRSGTRTLTKPISPPASAGGSPQFRKKHFCVSEVF